MCGENVCRIALRIVADLRVRRKFAAHGRKYFDIVVNNRGKFEMVGKVNQISVMNFVRIIFILLLFIPTTFTVFGNSSCQVVGDKLSASEEREVREFAERFGDQIKVTRNLAPFINQPVASSMLDRVLRDADDIGLVSRDVALKVSKYELRQYYIAMVNVAYLSDLYTYSKFSIETTNVRDLPLEQQYPSNVFRLMKSNPTIAKWWNQSESDGSEKIVESVEQLRSIKNTWQRAAALMRQYFRKHQPERNANYQKNLLYLAAHLKRITVDEPCNSEESCVGLPLNTQTINVNLPALKLILVRISGRLEILTIGIQGD